MKSRIHEFLKTAPLLSELDEEEILEFADLVVESKMPEEETIFLENEVGARLYIIREGQVKITKYTVQGEEKILAILGPGSHFGEMALIDDDIRSANAITITKCILYEIHRNDFESLAEMNLAVGYKIMNSLAAMLSKRLRKMDNDFISIFNQPFKSIKELEQVLSKVQSSVMAFGWEFKDDQPSEEEE